MNLPHNADAMVTGIFKFAGQARNRDPATLSAGSFIANDFKVLSYRGREAVNELYRVDVVFTSVQSYDALKLGADGQAACLTIKRGPKKEPRLVQGVVDNLAFLGRYARDPKLFRYRLSILPKMSELLWRRRNRIYQNYTVREIIEDILEEIDILPSECEWHIPKELLPRLDYVCQLNESDYDFVMRLLAMFGIFLFFEHPSGLAAQFLPMAGALAGAAGAVGSMMGGAAHSAVKKAGAATKMLTIMHFGDHASHTVAVQEMAAVNQAAAGAAKKLISKVGAKVLEKVVDLSPSASFPYDDRAGVGIGERVHAFSFQESRRPKALRLRDVDLGTSQLWIADAEVSSVTPTGDVRIGASIGRDGLSVKPQIRRGLDVDSPTIPAEQLREDVSMFVRHLQRYPNADERAEHELARRRVGHVKGAGMSNCAAFAAGYRLKLEGHPAGFDGEYIVTLIEYEGVHPDEMPARSRSSNGAPVEAPPSYANSFECIPAHLAPLPDVPPERPSPRTQIATVLGFEGPGMTPHMLTNEWAYVRVRFDWQDDVRPKARNGVIRAPTHYDRSTCWLPVLGPWAGDEYGALWTPRPKMRVGVDFFDGDPDRPFVNGAMYGAKNRLPWQDRTKHQMTGWRTRSWPGGTPEEYHELSFDDTRGEEKAKFRAQRDMDVEVLNDRTTRIGVDDSLTVGRARKINVGGNAVEEVGGDKATNVIGSRSDSTEKDHRLSAGGNLTLSAANDRTERVGGEWTQEAASLAVTLEGDYALSTGGAYHRVTGNPSEEASDDVEVYGSLSMMATQSIRLRAVESLVINVGKSQLQITENSISLTAPELHLKADSVSIKADKAMHVTAKDSTEIRSAVVRALSSGASLRLEGDAAKIDGGEVILRDSIDAEERAKRAADPRMVQFTTCLRTPFGTPIANATYHLDYCGDHFEGVTDADGMIREHLAPQYGARVIVRWWPEGEYPHGRPFELSIKWWDRIGPVDSDLGALIRLRNLGFVSGALPESHPEELAALKKEALAQFIRSVMKLEPSTDHEPQALSELLKLHGH